MYSDTSAASGRELCHLQLSLQAASPETFGYTLVPLPLTLTVADRIIGYSANLHQSLLFSVDDMSKILW
jgi:hypothetical protein